MMNDNELKEGSLIASRYELREYVGSGSFGEVWRAYDTEMEMDVAIKLYISLDKNSQDEFKQEYRVVYGLRDEHLLTADYYGVWDHRPFLIMKYCSRGSTAPMVGKIDDERVIWQFIHDVAAGLSYLHRLEPPILHQDIKPENILADDRGRFLVTDFGISRRMRSTMRKASKRTVGSGAMAYMGPERFLNDPLAVKASDIWSLGVSAYELATGDLPFMGQGGGMMLGGAQLPNLDASRWSARLNDVIRACMAKETWERPTAAQLVDFTSLVLDGNPITWQQWFQPVDSQGTPKTVGSHTVMASAEQPDDSSGYDLDDDEPRSKKWLWILLGALGVAVAAAAAWYFTLGSGSLLSDSRSGTEISAADREQITERFNDFAAACRSDIRNAKPESYQLLIEARALLDSLALYADNYPFVKADIVPGLEDSYTRKATSIRDRYLSHAREYLAQQSLSAWGLKNAIQYFQIAGMLDNSPAVSEGLQRLAHTYSTPIVFMAVRRVILNGDRLTIIYDNLYDKAVNGIPMRYDITTPEEKTISGQVEFNLETGSARRLDINVGEDVPAGSTIELSNKSVTFHPIAID